MICLLLNLFVEWGKTSPARLFNICIIEKTIPHELNVERFRLLVEIAVETYRPFTGLNFKINCKNPKMYISFVDKDHNRYSHPSSPIEKCDDLPNNVLAHAFYPPGYDIHISKNKRFNFGLSIETVSSFHYKKSDSHYYITLVKSFPLLPIIIHEMGHSMGLKHSTEKDSVMVEDNLMNLGLTMKDINTLEELWKHES